MMLTIDTAPVIGVTAERIPHDGIAEVMTFRVLDARLHAWLLPVGNFVWWMIDDHRPDVLVEVIWRILPSGARYDVHSVRPLTYN